MLADANGIVSIPRARVREAIELASEVVRKENKVKDEILLGRSIFDIFNLEQYVTTGQRRLQERNRRGLGEPELSANRKLCSMLN